MNKFFSNEQLEKLLSIHVERVIDSLDMETLTMYAMDCLRKSFRNKGEIDEDLFLNELFEYQYDEEESVKEFLIKNGIDEEIAKKVIDEDYGFALELRYSNN